MKNCGADDFFEVRKESLSSSLDLDSMTDLYLPLIGPHAYAVFFSLRSEGRTPSTHTHLLKKLQLSPGQFYQAMLPLEAMGLVKTYYQEDGRAHYFIYCVRSPLDPRRFLSDVLYRGMLEKYLGKDALKALFQKYKVDEPVGGSGFEDVSESFKAFFSPNLSDPLFGASFSETRAEDGRAHANVDFDFRVFEKSISEKGIASDSLSQKEIEKIERLSSLYCLAPSSMGDFVSDCYKGYEAYGNRIDFTSLEKRCRNSLSFPYLHQENSEESQISSSSVNANLIRVMERLSPSEFLSYLQKGHKPSGSDLKLVSHLASDIGLSNSAINALLFFALQKNDNQLPYNYVDKVGASLVREGCQSARDAWEYLRSPKRKKTPSATPSKKIPDESPKEAESPKETRANEKEVSDEEVEAALSRLFGKK